MLHTPGHTGYSMCLVAEDRVFTDDTLLIGATGRTDLPGGDASVLFDSRYQRVARLEPALRVYPAHDYQGRSNSTIGAERGHNPRLPVHEREAFVAMMKNLDLGMPTHITEALRTNMSGGKTVAGMLAEAAATVPFMSLEELNARVAAGDAGLMVLTYANARPATWATSKARGCCRAACLNSGSTVVAARVEMRPNSQQARMRRVGSGSSSDGNCLEEGGASEWSG